MPNLCKVFRTVLPGLMFNTSAIKLQRRKYCNNRGAPGQHHFQMVWKHSWAYEDLCLLWLHLVVPCSVDIPEKQTLFWSELGEQRILGKGVGGLGGAVDMGEGEGRRMGRNRGSAGCSWGVLLWEELIKRKKRTKEKLLATQLLKM